MSEAINWEAVKVLAMAVGVREAARRLGINEETAKKRCTREGWLNDPRAREANRQATAGRAAEAKGIIVPNVSPSTAMAMELQALGQKSKLSAARGMAKAMEHIEHLDGQEIIADAGNVKSAIQATGMIHSWSEQQPTNRMRIDVLLSKPETHVDAIEIESEVVKDEWDNA